MNPFLLDIEYVPLYDTHIFTPVQNHGINTCSMKLHHKKVHCAQEASAGGAVAVIVDVTLSPYLVFLFGLLSSATA